MAGGASLTLENLTIANGLVQGDVQGGGGGIFNEGVAILNGSRVRFNTAGNAGGVLNVNLITLNSSVISSNVPDDCEGC